MLFDSANLACKKMQCSNTLSSPCHCPSGQSFDSFSLSCSLNCGTVFNSLLQVSYGNPSKCSCNTPYEWNAKISDCSLIDCSLIDKSSSISINASCPCTEGYEWNDTNLSCSLSKAGIESIQSSSSSHVGLIIGIIFALLIILRYHFSTQCLLLSTTTKSIRKTHKTSQKTMISLAKKHCTSMSRHPDLWLSKITSGHQLN